MKGPIIRPVAFCPHYQIEAYVIETTRIPSGQTFWHCQLCLKWHRLTPSAMGRGSEIVGIEKNRAAQEEQCH